ncbi:zinc ribbon domain-containing protein [Salinibacter sp.]|uniref:zinc ribbon domain-containing protein n=1 Tax=Salinibacter sp. TaxID=2065818 RepID=UPI0021E88503|nr:zinc ribbon domain-containing protein [Salinibacter sp.]
MIAEILLVQAIACGVLSAIVASNKNRNVAGWGALGFLFGVLGFIASIAVSEVEETEQSSRTKSTSRQGRKKSTAQDFDPDEHEKKCPMCAEYIKLEAHRCKHCGHEFSQEEVEQQIEEARRKIEKRQEKITQDAKLYCERSEVMVHTDMLNSDGTCPACGNPASDEKHPLEEEISGDGS